jgi:zinc and cadmium transporter
MNTLFQILASVFIVSAISLIGVLSFMLKEGLLDRILFILIAFAAGSLLGAAFLDLLPEALESGDGSPDIFIYVLFGIVLFFILERFIFWHHCHKGQCDVHSFSYLILVGDGVHNFLDGIIIAASFMIDPSLGIVTTLAIIFHEIPQEMGDFGILVYGGLSKARALLYNFISALTAFVGAILTYFFSPLVLNANHFLIAFAAGGFIYIASTDLMPELQKESELKKSFLQFVSFVAGIFLIWAVGQVL